MFELRVRTKVHKKENTLAGRLEVIVNLGPMLVVQPTECLDFKNDLLEDHEIGFVSLYQDPPPR